MSAFYEMSEMRRRNSVMLQALVPVGATEQHGPYLALAMDYVVAYRLAQAIARRLCRFPQSQAGHQRHC
jgi:creatinine amidohydrolase/Fe(II)-dependent formamide hydrolase-like protein